MTIYKQKIPTFVAYDFDPAAEGALDGLETWLQAEYPGGTLVPAVDGPDFYMVQEPGALGQRGPLYLANPTLVVVDQLTKGLSNADPAWFAQMFEPVEEPAPTA